MPKKNLDPHINLLRKLYLDNNMTHQINTLYLYTELRLGYQYAIEWRHKPKKNDTGVYYKKKIRTYSDKFKLVHHIQADDFGYMIFEILQDD